MNLKGWIVLLLFAVAGCSGKSGGQASNGDVVSFTSVVAKSEHLEGLLDVYRDKESGETYLAIKPDQIDRVCRDVEVEDQPDRFQPLAIYAGPLQLFRGDSFEMRRRKRGRQPHRGARNRAADVVRPQLGPGLVDLAASEGA